MNEKLSKPQIVPYVGIPRTLLSEVKRASSEKIVSGDSVSSQVLTDARRMDRNGKKEIGFQTSYLALLPEGTSVDIFWTGKYAPRIRLPRALQKSISEKAQVKKSIVLLTGGEHLHPKTTGTDKIADIHDMAKFGEIDIARDRAGVALLDHAEENNSPIVAICRGQQLVVNYFSGRLAIPEDHGQKHHKFELTKEGVMLRYHGVKDILPEEIRESLNIKPPEVNEVNSAHAQGFKVRDIDDVAMEKLKENGWYPWLVANVSDVDPKDQTYEGWLRVQDGKITGVMTQFHPEIKERQQEEKIRQFIHKVIQSNV